MTLTSFVNDPGSQLDHTSVRAPHPLLRQPSISSPRWPRSAWCEGRSQPSFHHPSALPTPLRESEHVQR